MGKIQKQQHQFSEQNKTEKKNEDRHIHMLTHIFFLLHVGTKVKKKIAWAEPLKGNELHEFIYIHSSHLANVLTCISTILWLSTLVVFLLNDAFFFDKFSILHTFCIQNAYDQRQSSWRLMKITALRMIVMEIFVFIWILIQN